MPHDPEDDGLQRYLLGEISDEEQTALERRYLEDEELFGRLRATEAELIEDYWHGRLTPDSRRRFEAHYLSSPVRRERAAFVKSLVDYASRSGTPGAHTHSAGAVPRRAAPAAAWARAAVWASVIVSGSLLAAWQWRSGQPGSRATVPSTPRHAPAEGRSATTVGPRPDLAQWQRLRPGRARSAESGTATITAGPGPIRVQLEFPRSGAGSYTLALQNADGREVWRAPASDAERGSRDWAVFVEIPSEALADGDYVLSLKAATGTPAAAAEYFFRVARR